MILLSDATSAEADRRAAIGSIHQQPAVELKKGDLYPNLPAVSGGRVVVLEQQRITGGSGLEGYRRLLTQLETTFAG
ncbi:MAG: hypothetical protein ACRDUV_05570 [Pseudonocardiaceae bacterium]